MVLLNIINLTLALYFAILTLLEVKQGGFFNAFVLATISATYFKGFVVKKSSYTIVASLIASTFSILMLLSYLASQTFSFGVAGIVTVPFYIYGRRAQARTF